MAVSSNEGAEFEFPSKYKERRNIPDERRNVKESERRVSVVYYLSRNGHLEHPHLMEVPLASPEGLYLRDVINRLNILRGKGMATMYSWSSKRSYKTGFVWHDLSGNDFIYPAHGSEYVLKGSELLDRSLSFTSYSISGELPETQRDSDFPIVRRRNQSWSSIDLHEYKVYKAESAGKEAANASTQTDDKTRRRKTVKEEENSPETLDSLVKCDLTESADIRNPTGKNHPSGRSKASAVLMQLISCGSVGVDDSKCEDMVHRGAPDNRMVRGVECRREKHSGGGIRVEDKEYFSGSVIEVKKEEFPALKRSSSYNADR